MLVMPFTRLANRFNLSFARYSLVNRPLKERGACELSVHWIRLVGAQDTPLPSLTGMVH